MSAPETKLKAGHRAHTTYINAIGERVPSVTTILNSVLAKPALIRWAYGLGKAGVDMDTYRDELADIGKLAHRMILDHLRKEKTDTSAYTKQQVDLAENAFIKYLEWERGHEVEPLIVEKPLVSEEHNFGGTPDFIGRVDGVMTLMDYKTGKAIYDDFWYQLGGYWTLTFKLNIQPIASFRILNIGRDESEQFKEEVRSDILNEQAIFLHALAIHKLRQKR